MTTAPLALVAGTSMFAGSVSTGGVVSCTVTVKLQLLVFLDASVALQVVDVDPSGKTDPEEGVQLPTMAPPQLSETVGLT